MLISTDYHVSYSSHVHHRVKKLVPRRNMAASYKCEAISQALDDMFAEYKDKLMEDIDLPTDVKGLKIGKDGDDDAMTINSSLAGDDASTIGDSSLADDVQELADTAAAHEKGDSKGAPQGGAVELAGDMPLAELDGVRPVAELPAEIKKGQMEDVSMAKPKYEMQG